MKLDLSGIMHRLSPSVLRGLLLVCDGREDVWGRFFPEAADTKSKTDYDGLVKAIQDPVISTDLVDALYFVHALGTSNGETMIGRQAKIDRMRLPFKRGRESYGDYVIRLLMEEKGVGRKFLERTVSLVGAEKRVAYAYFPHRKGFVGKNMPVSDDAIEALRMKVANRLVSRKIIDETQKRAVRVFFFEPEEDAAGGELLFLLRYPGKLNREMGCDLQGDWNSYVFNPAQYDTVIYDPHYNALKMNVPNEPRRTQSHYLKDFSSLLFGDDVPEDVFVRVPNVITMDEIGVKRLEDIFVAEPKIGLLSLKLESITFSSESGMVVETQLKVDPEANLIKSSSVEVLQPDKMRNNYLTVRRFIVRYKTAKTADACQLVVERGEKVNYPRDTGARIIENWLRLHHFIREEAEVLHGLESVESDGESDGVE